jgi:hypothetical protein
MKQELKPCPFCGGEAEYMGTAFTAIRCTKCGVSTHQGSQDWCDQVWNTRTDAPEADGWIRVEDRLPKEYSLGMSKDVLTIAGIKQSVKSYDYELKRWNGSPHVTITHWRPLPSPPKEGGQHGS